MGFNKVDEVFKPGDVSVKGDVVDVFPIYEKKPVRISFDFNKIEFISFFDIDTQRTVRNIKSYGFWDVLGREVELGRSLVNFVNWNVIASITKEGGFYSVLQTNSRKCIKTEIVSPKTQIRSKRTFYHF